MLMVLLIRDEDIKAVEITPEEVIEVVEDACCQDGMGLAFETPASRSRSRVDTSPI